ncbi:MAG: phosphoglucosamine mutase [Thermoguttaceae bacterium]|nr:phosphoglucosamine mutase [Thermoguttaceae bacterium]
MRKKNAAPLIISVSGLRGQVGSSLTPDVVQRYIFAYAEFLRLQNRDSGGVEGKTILVSNDGRESSAWITEEVERGFRAGGVKVLNIGVAATPTTGFLVKKLGFPAGVQISASHNPNPWNGIKLFNAEGRVIPAASGEKVKRFYHTLLEEEFVIDADFDKPDEDEEQELPPKLPPAEEFQKPHIDAILKLVDVKAIKKRKFTVLIDSNHGAGSVLAPVLMKALGCKLIFSNANEKPDGKFVHTPEPIAENLKDVGILVPGNHADVGFCQDPDADRLAILAEDGTYIGEECTVALCAKDVFLQGNKGPVVTNCSTSQMTRDLCAEAGCEYAMTPVGEANVVDKMIAMNAIFGGEGNGGPIHPQVGFVRDSFLGMALVLDLMARTGKKVSELAAELPQYAISKSKVSFERMLLDSFYDELKFKFEDAQADTQDGLRLAWEKSWIQVRPSNTEPVIRIFAEAPTQKEADKLCKAVVKLAKNF